MPASLPTIYLIAGCNGAGKTTFAKEFLPHEVKCLRFYNADEIARGLSPLDLRAGAIRARRVLLNEIRDSLDRHELLRWKARSAARLTFASSNTHFPWAMTWSCIISGFPAWSRRSRACTAAFAWAGTTFQSQIFVADLNAASIILSMIIWHSPHDGRFGTTVASPRNGSRLLRLMM